MYCNKMFLVKCFCTIINISSAARILGIAPTPSYSHQIAFQRICKELSLQGHQVTMLTTDPLNDQQLVNLTEIDLSFTYDIWNKNLNQSITSDLRKMISVVVKTIHDIEDQILNYPQVRDLIEGDSQFDLVIAEYFMITTFAFAERFNCPLIAILSLEAPTGAYQYLGNPTHPVLYPDFLLAFDGELQFSERLISVIYTFGINLYGCIVHEVEQNIVKKYFGDNYPHVTQMAQNISLLFVNTDFVFHQIRPLVPSIIQIGGGIHRKPAKPLPKNLQIVMDDAVPGVIYFSLGSNVKSKDIPIETRKVILQAFSELPYTILWKFELEHLPNKSNNVFISKWFPQQDVLKHPNVKLFITQGGLQSAEEAIYDHIPMVGMPFFGDQANNVKKMVRMGFGLSVDHSNLHKEQFKQTILEVIKNPKYRNKIKELAELATDQPMSGLERAVWWTEYVLRHKGAKHLRSPLLDIPLYQYLLLDVIAVLLLCLVILIYVQFLLVKLIVKVVKYILGNFNTKLKVL